MPEKMQHKNVYEALSAFQAEMPVVEKSADNPHFRSKYADITAMTKDAAPLLAKHGMAFTCSPRSTDDGFILDGRIVHAASETSVIGELPLFGNKPQDIGSSITYARRYLLGCLTGITSGNEPDDEGNYANTATQRTRPAALDAKSVKKAKDAMYNASTKTEVRKLWQEHSFASAPSKDQAEVTAHVASLPEGEEVASE